MRHGKTFNHLGRKAPHRRAMLSNMASSLILNKRITTTVAKAKALRKYVEPLLTRAKDDTTQARRVVFSYLQDKQSVQILFDEIAAKIADRPGGYTRIIKLADTRLGDSSELCMMELVDYNDLMLTESEGKKKTRRSRRGKSGKAKSQETTAAADSKSKEAKEDKPKAEAKTEEAKAEEPKAEDPKAEASASTEAAGDTAKAEETPKAENKSEEKKSEDESSDDESKEDKK